MKVKTHTPGIGTIINPEKLRAPKIGEIFIKKLGGWPTPHHVIGFYALENDYQVLLRYQNSYGEVSTLETKFSKVLARMKQNP